LKTPPQQNFTWNFEVLTKASRSPQKKISSILVRSLKLE
jgi:hypothetical protein